MAFEAGQQISHYRLLETIGEGGMGVVWRARDLALQRDVAIKVLPAAFASDLERRSRFEREARVLASLSHPQIAAIYGLESNDDDLFLVMELVRGETLAERLAGGALVPERALEIAAQVAEALQAAHDIGVIHRDLKPANVMVDPAGKVKVLDFGLAKHFTPHDVADGTQVRTVGPAVTSQGTILGTAGYMSPEQARGDELDRRTDIWALGCILYEALAGRRAFPGRTTADALAAVLEREPDWEALPRSTPTTIRRLLQRCLRKDVEDRLSDVGEALKHIRGARRAAAQPAAAWLRWLPWAILAVVLATVATVALRRPARQPAPAHHLPELEQVTFAQGVERSPAWSPDGRSLAFSGETEGPRKIFVKDLEGGEEHQVTGGDHDDVQPVWSADGRSILFVRGREAGVRLEPGDVFGSLTGGDIWSVDLGSGAERRLVEEAANPAVSPEGGRIAVDAAWVGARRIWLTDTEGRNPVQLTTDDSEEVTHLRPRWSSDGGHIVFQTQRRTVFDLAVVRVDTRHVVQLTDDHFQDLNPVWSHDGNAVYFSSNRSGGYNVWEIGVDLAGGSVAQPQQISTGPGEDIDLSMSPDGSHIAFSILRQNADIWALPVSPGTGKPSGRPRQLISTTREDSRGAWSPDGTMVAFNSDRAGEMNIWIHDVATGVARRLTRGPGGDYQPRWSRDGQRIVFFSSRRGSADIWVVEVGSGVLTQLTDSPAVEVNPAFSPDGAIIAYQSDQDGRREVWVMNADGSARRPLTRLGVTGHYLQWTDDGTAVVFRCSCGGQARTMLAPLDGGEATPLGEVVGGSHMSFSPDRSRILDVSGHKVLWVSPLDGGTAEAVFQFDEPGARIDYPVWSPDGTWVLFDRFQPQGGDLWIMGRF